MSRSSIPSRKARRHKKKMVLLCSSLPVILILLMLLFLFCRSRSTDGPSAQPTPTVSPSPRPSLQIDPNAGALVTPTPAPTVPNVAIPGWGRMTIPYGEKEVATTMKNPDSNEGWYYITFELRLKETDEVLFTTGLIPPGQYCNRVTLNFLLEPGEYPAVVRVQPYRMSDQSPTNNADIETVLVVE